MLRQVWKERVCPHLEQHLAQRVDSVTAYLLLYHEVHLTPFASLQTPCAREGMAAASVNFTPVSVRASDISTAPRQRWDGDLAC